MNDQSDRNGYSEQERADDVDSLRAQIESLRRASTQLFREWDDDHGTNFFRLIEKANSVEYSARGVQRDAKLIIERSGL